MWLNAIFHENQMLRCKGALNISKDVIPFWRNILNYNVNNQNVDIFSVLL